MCYIPYLNSLARIIMYSIGDIFKEIDSNKVEQTNMINYIITLDAQY